MSPRWATDPFLWQASKNLSVKEFRTDLGEGIKEERAAKEGLGLEIASPEIEASIERSLA